MKKILIVFAAAVAAALANAAAPKAPAQPRKPQPQRTTTVKRAPAPAARSGSRHRGGHDRDRYDRLSHHDRRLIDSIEDADSLHELRRYLQAAAMSRSEEVRMAMVDALEDEDMHGRSASDLAYFIADPSERVSAAAFSASSPNRISTRKSPKRPRRSPPGPRCLRTPTAPGACAPSSRRRTSCAASRAASGRRPARFRPRPCPWPCP